MAEITRQRQGELVRGVFKILKDHPDGMNVGTLLKTLEVQVPPTDFENSMYPNHPNVRRCQRTFRNP